MENLLINIHTWTPPHAGTGSNTLIFVVSTLKVCIQDFKFQNVIMHQSIPAVPIPPPLDNRGAFAHVVSPGVVHSQFCHGPWGWALAYPGATPGRLSHVFSKDR